MLAWNAIVSILLCVVFMLHGLCLSLLNSPCHLQYMYIAHSCNDMELGDSS